MHLLALVVVVLAIVAFTPPPGLSAQAIECDEAGTITRETYLSGVSAHERKYTIYLPPCYRATDQSYPLLMLLHGSNADDSQWARLGFLNALEAGIHEGSAPTMIVLMPYGGSLANQNHFNGLSYDAILLDLLVQVDERYRTDGRRALGGISRGGFWAYHLGLRFPNSFVAIGGHSPFFDANHAEPAYNPLDLAQSINDDTHLRLWMDRGTDDHAAGGIDRMRVILRGGNVPHEYIVYAGGDHSEASWRQFVGDFKK